MKVSSFFVVLFFIFSSFQCQNNEVKLPVENIEMASKKTNQDLAAEVAADESFKTFLQTIQSLVDKHDTWFNALAEKDKTAYLESVNKAHEAKQKAPILFITAKEFGEISTRTILLAKRVSDKYQLSKLSTPDLLKLLSAATALQNTQKNNASLCCDAVFESYVACSFTTTGTTEACWNGYLAGSRACGNCHGNY